MSLVRHHFFLAAMGNYHVGIVHFRGGQLHCRSPFPLFHAGIPASGHRRSTIAHPNLHPCAADRLMTAWLHTLQQLGMPPQPDVPIRRVSHDSRTSVGCRAFPLYPPTFLPFPTSVHTYQLRLHTPPLNSISVRYGSTILSTAILTPHKTCYCSTWSRASNAASPQPQGPGYPLLSTFSEL